MRPFLASRLLRLAMVGALEATTIVACNDDDGPNEPNPGLVTVTISPGPSTVQVGANRQFSATVTGYDGNRAITWQSLNEAVATVSTTGLVTGLAPGTADILAILTADNAIRSAVRVTVTQ